jgi:hypothetical protein
MANKPEIRKAVQTNIRRPSQKRYIGAALSPDKDMRAAELETAERKAPLLAPAFRNVADNARRNGKEGLAAQFDRKAAAAAGVVQRSAAPTHQSLLRETPVYSPSDNASWIGDMVTLRQSVFSMAPTRDSDYQDAIKRLSHFGMQQRAHLTERDEQGLRLIRTAQQTFASMGYLPWENERKTHEFVRSALSIPTSYRDVSTGATSLGTFAPPSYWTANYELWRTTEAPLLAAAHKVPDSGQGLVAAIPMIGAPIGVGTQSGGENTSVLSTGAFSAQFASAAFNVYVSSVIVSEQLRSRIGGGIELDKVVSRQAGRETATAVSTAAWADITSLAGWFQDNVSATFNNAYLQFDVAQAIQYLLTRPGVNAHPGQIYIPPTTLAGFTGQTDSVGHPIWEDKNVAPGPNNEVAGDDSPYEGANGYSIQGLNVFADQTTGGPSAGYGNIIVADADLGLTLIESEPIVAVYPEAVPASLSCFVSVRQYVAFALPYGGKPFAVINGSAYPLAFP